MRPRKPYFIPLTKAERHLKHDAKVDALIKVNAWTEWGTLKAIVVGDAHNAAFPQPQPAFMPAINLEGGRYSGHCNLCSSCGARGHCNRTKENEKPLHRSSAHARSST